MYTSVVRSITFQKWWNTEMKSYCSLSWPKSLFKVFIWGLPWWSSGWESACHCRGHGLDPWSGKMSCALEQLNPCTITIEPVLLESGAATREANVVRSLCTTTMSSLRSPQLEKTCSANRAAKKQKYLFYHNFCQNRHVQVLGGFLIYFNQ